MTRTLLLWLISLPALAAPPPSANQNSPEAAWWRGALTEGGGSCCDQADGRRVQICFRDPARWSLPDMGWQVLLNGKCVDVPPSHVLVGYPAHPAGVAAAWFASDGSIRCFAPPVAGR